MSLMLEIAGGVFIGQVATAVAVAGINYYTETKRRVNAEKFAQNMVEEMDNAFAQVHSAMTNAKRKPAPRKKPVAKNTTPRKSEKKVVIKKAPATAAKKGGKR